MKKKIHCNVCKKKHFVYDDSFFLECNFIFFIIKNNCRKFNIFFDLSPISSIICEYCSFHINCTNHFKKCSFCNRDNLCEYSCFPILNRCLYCESDIFCLDCILKFFSEYDLEFFKCRNCNTNSLFYINYIIYPNIKKLLKSCKCCHNILCNNCINDL